MGTCQIFRMPVIIIVCQMLIWWIKNYLVSPASPGLRVTITINHLYHDTVFCQINTPAQINVPQHFLVEYCPQNGRKFAENSWKTAILSPWTPSTHQCVCQRAGSVNLAKYDMYICIMAYLYRYTPSYYMTDCWKASEKRMGKYRNANLHMTTRNY